MYTAYYILQRNEKGWGIHSKHFALGLSANWARDLQRQGFLVHVLVISFDTNEPEGLKLSRTITAFLKKYPYIPKS